MGFNDILIYRWATPLPIITGPEALRPTLSRGLPFSQLFILSANTYKTLDVCVINFELYHIDMQRRGMFWWDVSESVRIKVSFANQYG